MSNEPCKCKKLYCDVKEELKDVQAQLQEQKQLQQQLQAQLQKQKQLQKQLQLQLQKQLQVQEQLQVQVQRQNQLQEQLQLQIQAQIQAQAQAQAQAQNDTDTISNLGNPTQTVTINLADQDNKCKCQGKCKCDGKCQCNDKCKCHMMELPEGGKLVEFQADTRNSVNRAGNQPGTCLEDETKVAEVTLNDVTAGNKVLLNGLFHVDNDQGVFQNLRVRIYKNSVSPANLIYDLPRLEIDAENRDDQNQPITVLHVDNITDDATNVNYILTAQGQVLLRGPITFAASEITS
ncbi:hypothetical protein CIB95_15265 [Lottiidibacillus patelloidae]|uniref:Uncharacterized protein n=2 Tax=Lottiidibacillus patelloidae TaxID=2670334 RepID=A0A263BPW1_9BACI|nr:hypothetical protein CIB95_15265 [Lottiidibacillus patelloidae]